MATDLAHHAPAQPNLGSTSDEPDTDNSLMIDMSTKPLITDPLFTLLSRTFTIRELVRLKAVNKTFATMVTNNMQLTTEARCEDDTKDWYFPLHLDTIFPKPANLQSPWIQSWTWSGVHHSSGRVHNLLSLMHLPWDKIDFNDMNFNCLLASAGGLLLFIQKYETLGPMQRLAWMSQDRRAAPPLLVSNPLTKEWRVLPTADCQDVRGVSWKYGGGQAYMVMDEKANTYKVILYLKGVLSVYKSTSNCWSTWSFPEPMRWRLRQGWSGIVPSAIVGGKLYFAELEVDGEAMPVSRAAYDMDMLTLGHVIVFEMNEEERIWKLPVQYPLGSYFPSDLHDNLWDYGFRIGSYAIALAECMGGMYTVIPARLNVEMDVGDHIRQTNGLHDNPQFKSYDEFGYLPLRFYILQLQGVGLPFGQLLIQIPHGTPENEHSRRKAKLWDFAEEDYLYQNPNLWYYPSRNFSWFRCTAWGSVIWVAFRDYLLQYDIVSGRSTTQILPDSSFAYQPDLSYRPSVHMKP